MATLAQELPDPKTLINWEDAFRYPIPNVRKIEQQLKTEIAGNKERLRSLVGQNYRDLLGTANSITHMSHDCKGLEVRLGDIGRRCNSGLIQKSFSRSCTLDKHQKAPTHQEVQFLAHLAIFRACPEVIYRGLLRGHSWLGVARVLVVSRLLYSQVISHTAWQKEIHAIQKRLLGQRRVVSRNLQVQLYRLDLEVSEIVEILTAYILISTSSGLDALRFFLQARLSAINSGTQQESGSEHVTDALQVFIQTIRTINGTVPKQLHRLLLKIKTEPLWESEYLRKIEEFDHEIRTPLIVDTVRSFVPFIRHDDLVPAKLHELLNEWIPQAFKQTLHSLDEQLANKDELQTIFDIRQRTIENWLANSDDLVQLDDHDSLTKLRTVFMGHLERIGLLQSSQIRDVCPLLKDALFFASDRNSLGSTTQLSPWNSVSESGLGWTDALKGHEKIRSISLNTPSQLSKFQTEFMAWSSDWAKSSACITAQRSTRWTQNISVSSDEVLSQSQETDIVSLHLKDLASLESIKVTSLSNAVVGLLADLDVLLDELRDSTLSKDRRSKSTALGLIFRSLRFMLDTAPIDADFSAITERLIPTLQKELIENMLEENFSRSLLRYQTSSPQIVLWTGDPPLPNIPSKAAFALVRSLHDTMGNAGPDLWSSSILESFATAVVRAIVKTMQSITSSPPNTLNDLETGSLNNGSQEKPAANSSDFDKQQLFDLLILREGIVHRARQPELAKFQALLDQLTQSGKMSLSEISGIEASAQAYWRKSSLLFGLMTMR